MPDLADEDVKDITTAMLTIERLLAGYGDADMHRAAGLLRQVLRRHGLADDDPPHAAREGDTRP